MIRSILLKSAPLIVLGCLYGGQVVAVPVKPAPSTPIDCTQGSVAITQTKQVTPTDTGWINKTIATTACLGAYSGNDQPLPKTNSGYYGDGLMNGAQQQGGITDSRLPFEYGAFIDGPNDPHLQDLDRDGKKNDPGWILLGKYDNVGTKEDPKGGFIPAKVLGGQDIVKSDYFSMSCGNVADALGCKSGTWALTPPATIKEQLAALNFKGFFDRLTIVLKASTGFALYYFDFSKIPSFDLNEVYNFRGTFDTGAFRNDKGKIQGLSHASIYVGDPLKDSRDVPEPAALSLLGLGLFGLGFVRKSAKRRTQGTPA